MQSRYYDPAIGRFINADAFVSTGKGINGHNMFAYCDNNAVSRIDLDGEDWMLALAGGGALASSFSLSSIGTTVLATLGAITPAGWIAIGAVAVVGIVTVGITYVATKTENATEDRISGPIGRRKNYNSRKKAKEAAKKAGGGKEPIHHPKGCHDNKKPHYHPNVKNNYRETPHGVSSHDHYYYPG